MRAKEVENQEKKNEKDLRYKYEDRVYNPSNKYLSRDYANIQKTERKNKQYHQRVLIDPTQNSQRLQQIITNKGGIGSSHIRKRKYQPLSENYRGAGNINRDRHEVSQSGIYPDKRLNYGKNQYLPSYKNQRNMNGKLSQRAGPSITPHSERKEGLLHPRLKENYKNANIQNNGQYIPPNGIKKLASINSNRSQPMLGGLRNNLRQKPGSGIVEGLNKYNSNQHSVDNGKLRGLNLKGNKQISTRRGDLSSAKQNNRIRSKHQYNLKPSSAKAPTW
eukprot:CAMPEP_0205810128 /NCGR_PEP_ID=MMETSP0205-20121125/14303_1 /ASSEMBLY_ACC=CAM_ASM_000278 /TAXON_ID=36767 /ORGANISM="Euplotes focardii, Strain TN1" /LENGTH=275 /DNA_ID=CAMNT_0053087939 /DNA_START=42 /DNA_END=866 /DNA_ORIENTATION=-